MHFVIILSVLYDDNFILAADRIHDRIIQVDLESGNLVKIPVKVVGVTGVAYKKNPPAQSFTQLLRICFLPELVRFPCVETETP